MLQQTNPEIVRKQEQIDNSRILAFDGYELTKRMEAEGLVNFNYYEYSEGCNTYRCYRGWSATLPHFKALGMWPLQKHSPTHPQTAWDFDQELFGFSLEIMDRTMVFGAANFVTLEDRRDFLLNRHIPRLEAELAELISEG